MTTSSPYTIDVPSLKSNITGLSEDDLILFRGLPFATIKQRWTHSQISNTLPAGFDATKYGPRCTQGEGLVLVTGGANDEVPIDDEFDCLNLNVTVPKAALESESGTKLPVMVWIHGGAFNYGANSVARYRPQSLMKMAVSQGTPVVLVQIQYRLGPLGFVASHDLATEAAQENGDNSHYLGNYGFVDQIHALEWVQNHISDFGGDATNVTAFGVSAGSASIHHHILSGKPLFDRAILMSGSAPTLGPLPFDLYQKAWQNFVTKVDAKLSILTPKQRLEKLRSLTPQEVIQHHSSAPLGPMGDDKLLPSNWNPDAAQTATRCKAIIIGDTQVEAIIMDGLITHTPFAKLNEAVQSTMKTSPSKFYSAFGIQGGMSQSAYLAAMRSWLSVGMFQYPAMLVARTFPGSVYFYHFDEPSTYPGKTFGIPYHGQCALFAHLNDAATYPAEARVTAESMGRIWTAFASGRQELVEPWEEFSVARRFMRFGPGGTNQVRSWDDDDDVRSYEWLEWVEGHFAELRDLTRALTIRP